MRFRGYDALIAEYGDGQLLQWLDGGCQVDGCVNLASTNFPERLDRRIVCRPRRFDRVLKIEPPSAEVRQAYFARKMPELAGVELAEWVERTESLSFAARAEVVIGVGCLGNGLSETIEALRSMEENETTCNAKPGRHGLPVELFSEQGLGSIATMVPGRPTTHAELIFSYSRKQAIANGVLVDVTKLAKEAGIKYPTAITAAVWHLYVVPDDACREVGQSVEGRLWDVQSFRRVLVLPMKSFLPPAKKPLESVPAGFVAAQQHAGHQRPQLLLA